MIRSKDLCRSWVQAWMWRMWRPPSLAVGMCLTSGASAENRRRAEFPFLGTTPDPPGPIVSLHPTILSHHIKLNHIPNYGCSNSESVPTHFILLPTSSTFERDAFEDCRLGFFGRTDLTTWHYCGMQKAIQARHCNISITQTTGLVNPTILDLHIISP